MATILAMQTAIVDALKVHLPVLKTCAGHSGSITPDELRRIITRAPAVLVACLGAYGVTIEGGQPVAELRWSAFVVVSHAKPQARDELSMALVGSLLTVVALDTWLPDARAASDIRAENLYSDEVDKQSVALWAVTWRQLLALPPELSPDELGLFTTYAADYDVHPKDGNVDARDRVTLPPP